MPDASLSGALCSSLGLQRVALYVKAELARMDKAADELLVQRDVGGGQQGRITRFLKEVLSVGGRRRRERRQQVGEARLEGRDTSAHGERERAGLADY